MKEWFDKNDKKKDKTKGSKIIKFKNKKPSCLRVVGYDSTYVDMNKTVNSKTYQPYSIKSEEYKPTEPEKVALFDREETIYLESKKRKKKQPIEKIKKAKTNNEMILEDSGALSRIGLTIENTTNSLILSNTPPFKRYCKTQIDKMLKTLSIGEKLIYEETKNIVEEMVFRTEIDINLNLQSIKNIKYYVKQYQKDFSTNQNEDIVKSLSDPLEVLRYFTLSIFETIFTLEKIQKEISDMKTFHIAYLVAFYLFKHGLICDTFGDLENNVLEFTSKREGANYKNNPFLNKCYKASFVFCNENNMYLLWKQNYKYKKSEKKEIDEDDFVVRETIPISNSILSSMRYDVIFSDYFQYFKDLFKRMNIATQNLFSLFKSLLKQRKFDKSTKKKTRKINLIFELLDAIIDHQWSNNFVNKANATTNFSGLFLSLFRSLGVSDLIDEEHVSKIEYSIKSECLFNKIWEIIDTKNVKSRDVTNEYFDSQKLVNIIDEYQSETTFNNKEGDQLNFLLIPIMHSFTNNKKQKGDGLLDAL